MHSSPQKRFNSTIALHCAGHFPLLVPGSYFALKTFVPILRFKYPNKRLRLIETPPNSHTPSEYAQILAVLESNLDTDLTGTVSSLGDRILHYPGCDFLTRVFRRRISIFSSDSQQYRDLHT